MKFKHTVLKQGLVGHRVHKVEIRGCIGQKVGQSLGELKGTETQSAIVIGLAGFDAMIMPTVACIPPTIADCESSMETYAQYNLLLLRNTGLINMLDGCAASLPCHTNGEPPVGLMVAGLAGEDKHVLAAARAVEGALADALAIN